MTKPSPKSPEIEQFLEGQSMAMFSRSRLQCIRNNICVMCGNTAKIFRDAISKKEFTISGICQGCQDKTFGTGTKNERNEDVGNEMGRGK